MMVIGWKGVNMPILTGGPRRLMAPTAPGERSPEGEGNVWQPGTLAAPHLAQ